MRSPNPVLGGAVLALLSAFPATGQVPAAAAPDTLRLDAVLSALVGGPTARAAAFGAEAARAEAGAAGAWPDPSVEVMVMPVPMHMGDGVQRSQWRAGQTVPWPGTLGLQRDAAGHAADAATARADAVVLDLALEAQEAYHTLAYVQTAEALVRDFRQRLGAFAEAAAVRYEVGQGPQSAILRAQLEGWRMEERLILLSQQRALAEVTLARLLDRPDFAAGPVVVEERVAPADVPALAAFAEGLRPDVAALDAEHRQAETEVDLARKAFYPNLGASLTYFNVAALDEEKPTVGHESTASGAGGRDALGVGVTVAVPLDRASRRARLEAARLRVREAEAQREALGTALETEILAHLHHAHHEREVLWVTRSRLLPQARSTVESTVAAYAAGQADFLLLLDAERTLFELRLSEAEALMRYHHAEARLARALGLPSLDALPDALR